MPEPQDVVDIATWVVISQEFRGAEAKDWVAHPDDVRSDDKGRWWLFKPIKTGRQSGYRRFDDVSEVIASRLAELLGLPAAQVRLASGIQDQGVISRNVAPKSWEMVSGDALLTELPGYVSIAGDERPRNRSGHHIDNIQRVLHDAGGPLDAACEDWAAAEVFVGYLIFDAWIANTDRHAENWGVIRRGSDWRLAHSYDHGSALASGIPDHELLATNVNRFARKGFASRFDNGAKLTLVELAMQAVELVGGKSNVWLERLARIEAATWDEVLGQTPRLSEAKRNF